MKIERKHSPLIIAGIFVALLILAKALPLSVYGIPAITIHDVSQTKPTITSKSIVNSYGSWIALDYSDVDGLTVSSPTGSEWVKLQLTVKLLIKMEVTEVASPRFLTKIEPSPFLVSETEKEILFKNFTIESYAYTLKVTTAWSGEAHATVLDSGKSGFLAPWASWPTYKEMAKIVMRDRLLPRFNEQYLTAAQVLLSIDAPTLGTDQRYALNPDYIGVFGMWLQDYVLKGYVKGTAAEAQPQSTGTPVSLFLDKELTQKCWSLSDPSGEALIQPDVVYWFDHYAPKGAWWQINILNLGSQLLFDDTKEYPEYYSWAWEEYGAGQEIVPPSIAQHFRIDLGFRVTKDFVVPRIPLYEISDEEKEKQVIIIKSEPENLGAPTTSPSVEVWKFSVWSVVPYILVGVGTIIVVYVLIRYKPWRKLKR